MNWSFCWLLPRTKSSLASGCLMSDEKPAETDVPEDQDL
jgi:hypothetical protein